MIQNHLGEPVRANERRMQPLSYSPIYYLSNAPYQNLVVSTVRENGREGQVCRLITKFSSHVQTGSEQGEFGSHVILT